MPALLLLATYVGAYTVLIAPCSSQIGIHRGIYAACSGDRVYSCYSSDYGVGMLIGVMVATPPSVAESSIIAQRTSAAIEATRETITYDQSAVVTRLGLAGPSLTGIAVLGINEPHNVIRGNAGVSTDKGMVPAPSTITWWLLADLLLVWGIWMIVVFLYRMLRRLRSRSAARTCRCVTCGYYTGHLPICPECGTVAGGPTDLVPRASGPADTRAERG